MKPHQPSTDFPADGPMPLGLQRTVTRHLPGPVALRRRALRALLRFRLPGTGPRSGH